MHGTTIVNLCMHVPMLLLAVAFLLAALLWLLVPGLGEREMEFAGCPAK